MSRDDARGLERYSARLPAVGSWVTLGEGDTPTIRLDRLAQRLGLGQLTAKTETQNPTGSYKDRIAAMSVSLARENGARGWIGTSSGNAGLAMAAYGARAGLPGLLCMVGGAPDGKRRALAPYGTTILEIPGVGTGGTAASATEVVRLVEATAKAHDLFVGITAHAFNPLGMRGADTIAYELADQVSAMTHVYVPTGGGGLLTAVARGLLSVGVPAAVVACQPVGCSPIVQCLHGSLASPRIATCQSAISALQLPAPPDGDAAVEAVTSSDGWGTAIGDNEILAAQTLLAEVEGLFVEPASAASLAALVHDVRGGRVGSGDAPVLVLTGAGWKDLDRMTSRADGFHTVPVEGLADKLEDWGRSLK